MRKSAAYRMILRRHPLWSHKDFTKEGSAAADLLQYVPDVLSNMDPATAAGLVTMAKINFFNKYGKNIPVMRDVLGRVYRSAAHAGSEAGLRGEAGLSFPTRFGMSLVEPNLVKTYETAKDLGTQAANAGMSRQQVRAVASRLSDEATDAIPKMRKVISGEDRLTTAPIPSLQPAVDKIKNQAQRVRPYTSAASEAADLAARVSPDADAAASTAKLVDKIVGMTPDVAQRAADNLSGLEISVANPIDRADLTRRMAGVAQGFSDIDSAVSAATDTKALGNRLSRALTLPVNKNLPKNLRSTLKGQY